MIDISFTKIIIGGALFISGRHLTGTTGTIILVLGIIILYDSFTKRRESLNHL